MEGFLNRVNDFIEMADFVHQLAEGCKLFVKEQTSVGFSLLLCKPHHFQAEALEGRCHRQSFKEIRIE